MHNAHHATAARLWTLALRLDEAYHLAGSIATEFSDRDADVVRLLQVLDAATSELERLASAALHD